MVRLFFTLFSILISNTLLFAGETVVTGTVTDSESGQTIPFVNVIFKGTTIGTMTDTTGIYYLHTTQPVDTISFVAMGYTTQSFKITKGITQLIDVRLLATTITLDEVLARPDNSQARSLFRQMVQKKEENNPENNKSYAYRRYTKWEYRINNVTDKMKQWQIFRDNKELFRNSADGTQFLPLYSSEQVVFNEYQKEPLKRKSTIEADHTTGLGMLSETEISGFTSGLETGINFYENSFEIMGLNFISPASNNGFFYYNYYLLDSVETKNGKNYILRFTPRRKGDNVFTGYLTIENQHYSIVEVDAKLNNTEHLNFIRGLNLKSSYQLVADSIPFFASSEITTIIDYMPVELRKNQERVELMAFNAMHFSDIEINHSNEIKMSHRRLSYESVKELHYTRRNDDYWQKVRPKELTQDEVDFKRSIEMMNDLPFIKFLDKMADMSLTGYLDLGKWELGPYDYMLNRNKVEGTHLYIGGRTGRELFQNFSIWGGVGYGTRNKQWLGRFGVGYILPVPRRTILQMEYVDDIVLIGENEKILYLYENKQHTSESNLFSYIFRRKEQDELFRRQRAKFSFERELRTGLTTTSSISWMRYHSPEFYPFTTNGNPLSNFNTAELTLNLRRSWDEKYFDYGFRRLYLGTTKPIINLALTGGYFQLQNKQQPFARMHSSYKHYFFIGQTRLDYAAEAGAVFGSVPFPLLDIPRANETYGFQRYNFNMINHMEFIHDKYLHAFIEYRLNGLIFSRTPLLKHLGLREVLTVKSMIGSISSRHQKLIDFQQIIPNYNNQPYLEAGVGIENILRFFRIDALWRLTPTNTAPTFGWRGRVEIKF